jgi:hypothetical protein
VSGTSTYDPPLADLGIDAFERCGIRSNALTTEHYQSLRRSMNLVQSRWSNRGVNLWKVDLVSVYMPQGVSNYAVDQSVVNILDVYLRQYQMGTPVSTPPSFSTTLGSTAVTIGGFSATPIVGSYVSVVVPVSVGGIVLQSFYQVVSVPSPTSCTVTATSAATSTVVTGGVVPQFTTQATNANVFVYFPNHGQVAGGSFMVQVQTVVGGLVLSGSYPVLGITDANNFTITAPSPAGYDQTVYENNGLTQLATQATVQGLTQNADPVDILLYPFSRNDWAAIPDKAQQGRPTSFWFDRNLSPTSNQSVNIWLSPDSNGPYQLNYYCMRRMQDAVIEGGGLGDFNYRFYEAFTAEVAFHLSMKWAAPLAQALKAYANECWIEASDEDREKVPYYVSPDFSSYYN